MQKEFIAFALLAFVVDNVESGIVINRHQLKDIPECIWIWYKKHPKYPTRRTTTTTATPNTSTATDNMDTTASASMGTTAEAEPTDAVPETTPADAEGGEEATTAATDGNGEGEGS